MTHGTAPGAPALLEVIGVAKSFGGVDALRGADLTVRVGEIHALLGENGAGKSTLVKILAGVHQRDAGSIAWDGLPLGAISLSDSRARGIRVIYQQLSTIPHLTAGQNLLVGRERHRLGFIDRAAERRDAERVLDRLGVRIDLDRPAGTLRVAERQLIEIGRALVAGDLRLLLMDEPTASLGEQEVDRLFSVIRGLRDEGIATIYISHKLDEVFRIAEHITVLRDGRTAGSVPVKGTSHEALIEMMVGRHVEQGVRRPSHRTDEALLEARDVWTETGLRGISFTLHRGEVMGVYGLLGSGRTELARALFGADRILNGEVWMSGAPLRLRSVADGRAAGIGLVPEERAQAAFPFLSVRENVTAASSDLVARFGWLRRALEATLARRIVGSLRVKTPSVEEPLGRLSGGNQQKVIVGRWLLRRSPVLILDDPTAGVDVGAKDEIYRIIERLTEEGAAVLMSSSELPELLNLADRILVLHLGTMAGILEGEITERAILQLAVQGRSSVASAA